MTPSPVNKKRKPSNCCEEESVAVTELKQQVKDLEKRANEMEERAKKAETLVGELKEKLDQAKTQEEGDDLSDDDEDSGKEDTTDPWIAKFLQLREYRILNGDCKVPEKGTNPSLGKWVSNQKQAYKKAKTGKKGGISQERINMLDGIDFFWGKDFPAPMEWKSRLEELQKFQKAMRHCNVTMNASGPTPLAKWVSAQRSEYRRFRQGKHSLLSLGQIGELNEIGFNWKGPRLS